MIPFYPSLDLELRLSNSDASSLLCARNRLRLRQLLFVVPPRFRWQPPKVPRRAPKVNPIFWSASRNPYALTTAESPAFLPATALSEPMPFILRGRKYATLMRIPQPPCSTNSSQPIAMHRGGWLASDRHKKRPLRAAAADRRFSASGRSGSQTRQHPEENSCSVDATMSV